MTEKKVVTPLGFLEFLIEIDASIPTDYMLYTRSKITAVSLDRNFVIETNALIGEKQAIPLRAGKYKVLASLGGVASKEIELDIETDQVQKVTFYFGKET